MIKLCDFLSLKNNVIYLKAILLDSHHNFSTSPQHYTVQVTTKTYLLARTHA